MGRVNKLCPSENREQWSVKQIRETHYASTGSGQGVSTCPKGCSKYYHRLKALWEGHTYEKAKKGHHIFSQTSIIALSKESCPWVLHPCHQEKPSVCKFIMFLWSHGLRRLFNLTRNTESYVYFHQPRYQSRLHMRSAAVKP